MARGASGHWGCLTSSSSAWTNRHGSGDIHTLAQRASGLIIVNINDRDLGDGRAGDLLADLPSEAQIAERVDRWWQLRGHTTRTWRDSPLASPGMLIGVSGRGALRMVIASLQIDRRGWRDAIDTAESGGLLRVPHDAANLRHLDHFQIRGRRIDVATGLHFGRFRHETFIVLDASGKIVKGGRKG